MSVKASNWVWHQIPTDPRIKHGHLIVLLALADISDDDGKCTYGDPEKRKQIALAAKTRMSESTFRRSIRGLEALELIAVDVHGLMNVYTLNFDWPQSMKLSPTGQDDRLKTDDENSRNDRYYRSTVTGHKNVIHRLIKNPLPNPTTERALRAVDNIPPQRPHPRLGPIPHPTLRASGIDRDQLVTAVGHFFADAGLTVDQVHDFGTEILTRAPVHVADPTAYAIASIRRDPFTWQQRAYEIAAGDRLLEGNQF